jgi:hypothetical protein
MSALARRALIGLLLAPASLGLAAHALAGRGDGPESGPQGGHGDSSDGGHGGGHDGDEHDAARDAVARGEALPLTDILARVGPSLGGQVIGVHFERHGGRWLYEFRVLAGGQLRVVHVDAATAEIVRSEVR